MRFGGKAKDLLLALAGAGRAVPAERPGRRAARFAPGAAVILVGERGC